MLHAAIKARAIQSHTVDMRRGTANIRSANNVVRHLGGKFLDGATPEAARAIDKVARLPRSQPRPSGIPIGTPGGAGPQTTGN